MPARLRLPSYCHHRPTGQAYVRLDGKFYYLGLYESPESRARYRELVESWQLRDEQAPDRPLELTVGELVLLYLPHARGYYVKNGEPTSEVACVEAAAKYLMPFRRRRAGDFGPLLLEAVRKAMVDAGLARTTVNAQAGRIRRMFRWAVAKQLVRPEVLVALEAVAPLRKGRSAARETPPVAPVSDGHVDAVLPLLPEPLRAAVEVLRLTGARSGELLAMRVGDLDRSGETWEYVPASHKTEHRGKRRVILIGPKAQEVIAPLLIAVPAAYVFRPTRGKSKRYHAAAIRKAVLRACGKVNTDREREGLPPIPVWHPHQLRHSTATRLRREAGLEVARTVLGHAKLDATVIYAERDLDAARRVVAAVG